VPGAEFPLERRAFFEGGPLGVEGDAAVALCAERCMNCFVVSNCCAKEDAHTHLHRHQATRHRLGGICSHDCDLVVTGSINESVVFALVLSVCRMTRREQPRLELLSAPCTR
jgi:hypothetical protein